MADKAAHKPLGTDYGDKDDWFYTLARRATGAFVRGHGGIKVVGAENVPKEGPVILAANHRSNLDPPYVGLACPRRCYAMGKEELFKIPIGGWIFRRVGGFPVKRGTADRASLRWAVNLAKSGRALIIFPEGKRTRTGKLNPAEKGSGLVARQSGAVIVPVAVDGTEGLLPPGKHWPGNHLVTVTFGQPWTPDKGMSLEDIGMGTMARIAELLGETPPEKESENKAKSP